MTSEEQSALRAMLREEVNAAVYASEQRTGERVRALVREEVNAAVYASEQRTGERLDKIDERLSRVEQHLVRIDAHLDQVDARQDKFEATVTSMDERLHRVEFLQTQMAGSLAQMGSVLNEATIKINELQMSFIALDQKVDGIKRDIQKLIYRADTAEEAISGLSLRLKMHRETPINEAHPPSAA